MVKDEIAEALAQRPAVLPEVEPELRASPPRTLALFTRTGEPIHERAVEVTGTYRAVKGWVVSMEKTHDYEGPDHHIRLAWEQDGEIRIEKVVIGYDSYHWAVSYPEHFAWFERTMQPGQPVTILLAPAGRDWSIYGQLEAFIDRGGNRVFAAD